MIDAFAGSQGIALNTVQCKAILGQGFVGEVPVFLAKPQIEMNLRDRTPLLLIISSLNRVLVFHDDMTSPCGVLRLYPNGGHVDHSGLQAEECDLSLSRERRISSASLNFQIS